MRHILYLLIIQILISGCGENSGILTTPDTVQTDTINLSVKIGYDNSLLEKASKRVAKRVKLEDIAKIQLTIFDSKKTHLKNTPFNETSSGTWKLAVYNLPTNTDVTFIAEAFDNDGFKILSGTIKKNIAISSSNIIIPLTLAKSEMVISVPTIESIYGGDIQIDEESNISTKRVTFKIINPNSEKVEWKLTSDKALATYGKFQPTSGVLDFRYKAEIDFTIDFNITNQVSENIAFKDLSFENRIDLNTSAGDTTTTFFQLYEQRNSLAISLAPIIDNISFLRKDGEISVHALINSKLLKTEVCFNKFDDLFSKNFHFAEQSFENLFRQFYISTDDEVDVDLIINNLKEDLNSSKDSNLSMLLAYDINSTFESELEKHQSIYHSDSHFNKIYNYLKDDGFIEMMDYYKSPDKDFIVILKNFYREDNNFSKIISNYQKKFGESEFSNFIKYMMYADESTLLKDYNYVDRNFSQNSDYYFQKFKAENNSSKENLYNFIEKIDDFYFKDFVDVFNTGGQKVYMLMQIFFQKYNIYDSRFATLLSFRIDQNFDSLFANMKNSYLQKDSVLDFVRLVENKNFQEYLYYYKNQTSKNRNFIRSKYDYDICQTSDFGKVYYDWSLSSNPYSNIDKPYIEDTHTNPIKILNTNGSFDDKIILKAENSEGVKTEYSFYKKMVNWVDENGKQVENTTSSNNQNETNNSNNNSGNNSNSDNSNDSNQSDNNTPKDWSFNLYTSNNAKLDLLYGETKTVKFSVSKDFNYTYDILGVQNISTFTTSNVKKISNKEFEVDITAKETEGVGKFSFLIQNKYFATSSDIELNIKKPIKINNLYNNYAVVFGETLDINFTLVNPRGDNFLVSVSNSSNNFFDVYPNELEVLNVKNRSSQISVRGLAEGQNTIILQITDISLIPNYSIEIPVKITVAKSYNQIVEEELSTKKDRIYSCRGASLNQNEYEYTSDIYDENLTPVHSPENMLLVNSKNSYFQTAPAYSTLGVLYPIDLISDNVLSEIYSAYNYSSNIYIGDIKYSKELIGKEFYLKYYDNETDTVICEKHKF